MSFVEADIFLTSDSSGYHAQANLKYNTYLASSRHSRDGALSAVIRKMQADGLHGKYSVTGDAYYSGPKHGTF